MSCNTPVEKHLHSSCSCTNYLHQEGCVFISVGWFVCPFVSRITQKGYEWIFMILGGHVEHGPWRNLFMRHRSAVFTQVEELRCLTLNQNMLFLFYSPVWLTSLFPFARKRFAHASLREVTWLRKVIMHYKGVRCCGYKSLNINGTTDAWVIMMRPSAIKSDDLFNSFHLLLSPEFLCVMDSFINSTCELLAKHI